MKRRIVSAVLCALLCVSLFPANALAAARDVSFEESLAADLKSLGLFRGVSENDFALNRAPTRIEALVMLIRSLGKERDALDGDWKHPFTDVPGWAEKYVGYAYENGLANGVGNGRFGTADASSAQYLTFVLRALGYSDANGTDFSWDAPYSLAKSAGILPDRVNTSDFLRADVVVVSYAALDAYLKGSDRTLAQKLIAAGAFTQDAFERHYRPNAIANAPAPGTVPDASGAMTAQKVYEKCSPAVFYITTKDIDGNGYASGSGFFIDPSGIAVTNHHVLENAASATALLTDGRVCDITKVLFFDRDKDFAVVKVEGSGFTAIEVGDSSKAAGGETVYAIGNPRGLTNSISDGIISNTYRADYGGMMQITAPISPGSSGGALINARGQVIGVTTAYLASGQNLNFAVPINDVLSGKDISGAAQKGYTFAEFLQEDAVRAAAAAPDAFENIWYESEPNNTVEQGEQLANGDSVYGYITDDTMDVFLAYCNTRGKLEVILFSHSDAKHVSDLILVSKPVNSSDESEAARSEYFESDGTSGRYLTYYIPRPGVYGIYLLSNSLYKTEDLQTDYSFYYRFYPGETAGQNTTGSSSGTQTSGRRSALFGALVDFVETQYNRTITSTGDKCYFVDDSGDSLDTTTGFIYCADLDELVVYCSVYSDTGTFYTYIWIPKDASKAHSISYSCYASVQDENANARAKMVFDPTLLLPGTDHFTLENLTVAAGLDKDAHSRFCKIMLDMSLHNADSIISSKIGQGYHIADLGFINYNY